MKWGGVTDCYDLTIQEIQELKKEYNEELFYLISTIFELGYIRGVKAEKNNKHKKARA